MKTLESVREEIWVEMKQLEDKRKDQWSDIKYQTLREVLQKLGHLDEPELPVIPKFVAEWIEHNQEDDLSDTIHFIIYGLYADWPDTNSLIELRKPVLDWLSEDRGNYFKLIDASRYGYTVEEEQKYVVELPNPNNQLGRHKNVFLNKKDGEVFIDSASLFVNDITKYGQFALTEEEIKKDFEWAWAFAKPVEELEE